MSLQPERLPEIPEETARVARILFPKRNQSMWLRDELGSIYNDEQFASLYPNVGQLAEQPWRLAIASVIQSRENYTDRQVAEAIKTRIDLKYALSLELTDPGFDFSVLSEFRSCLIKGSLEDVLLTTLLSICRERGYLQERGKQRTASTHVEAAIRLMNRIECAGEALRAALNSLAVTVPGWLRAHVPQEWYDRYEKRMEDFRIPKEATKRAALVEQIGQDGFCLQEWIRQADAPFWLREIPAVEILRQVWIQQFSMEKGQIRWRSNENIPPASRLIFSPDDTQAQLSVKRNITWTSYKAHFTETCDDTLPHLIIHVETTSAPIQDMDMTEVIHQELAHKQLLPEEHLMDTGYVDGKHIVNSQKQYGIELIGPVLINGSWQAKESQGFDSSQFLIDWEKKTVTCPQGKTSHNWTEHPEHRGIHIIQARFGKRDCLACPVRAQCTRSATNPRQLCFRSQEQYEAIQTARKQQTTKEFKQRYAKRSGIEGTISQGVRAFDLRVSRYLGLKKTHLQHLRIAIAMNVVRLFQWQMGFAPFQTSISRFAALAA